MTKAATPDYRKKFDELGVRITEVRASLEQARQEEVALADILHDLLKERDKAILDSRGTISSQDVGSLLGLHESTVRNILAKELRRHGMGVNLPATEKSR